jgi:hypothetical protein
MIQVQYDEIWPPPDWTEIVIVWDDIIEGPKYPIKEILAWVDSAPGGRYHLHGFNSTEGFSFRFERPEDAVHFKLRWL